LYIDDSITSMFMDGTPSMTMPIDYIPAMLKLVCYFVFLLLPYALKIR